MLPGRRPDRQQNASSDAESPIGPVQGFGRGAARDMIVSSYTSDKAVKGEASQIQGRGLFAIVPIPTGEIARRLRRYRRPGAAPNRLPVRPHSRRLFRESATPACYMTTVGI